MAGGCWCHPRCNSLRVCSSTLRSQSRTKRTTVARIVRLRRRDDPARAHGSARGARSRSPEGGPLGCGGFRVPDARASSAPCRALLAVRGGCDSRRCRTALRRVASHRWAGRGVASHTPENLQVAPLDGTLTVEIGYRVARDGAPRPEQAPVREPGFARASPVSWVECQILGYG
jgi:hypothetical protein